MSLLRRAAGVEQRSLPDVYGSPGFGWWGQGMVWHSASGINVRNPLQAMQLSAVYACIRLLSESVSTLESGTFTRKNGAKVPVSRPPAYLDFQPPQIDQIDYLSQVMLSLLTDGNAYILTPRDDMGVPVTLIPLDPSLVNVARMDGKLTYSCMGITLDPNWDLMHIKGMCLPGQITGVSPIAAAAESINLGLAAQDFGGSFFRNGALPSAVIEHPSGMKPEAAQRFKDWWYANHSGSNQQSIGVLTEGATLNKVSIQPNDAQFLETRGFQVPDIARFYGVPPHLIADASNSTSWGTGLMEQNAQFYSKSIRPWVKRLQGAHTRLLTTHGMRKAFWSLDTTELLAPTAKEQVEIDVLNLQNGIVNVDAVRASRDLEPLPNGKGEVYRDPAPTATVSPKPNQEA